MKKSFAMLSAALLLLTACGQTPSPDTPPPASLSEPEHVDIPADNSSQSIQTEDGSETPETATPAPTNLPETVSNLPNGSEPMDTFDPSATIDETVLVDENNVKITATGIKYTAYEVKLNLTIENNSEQSLSFHAGTIGYCCNSVNGYMVDSGYLNADVAPGKKTNETISFDVDELMLLGINDIADIELGFSISDSNYDDYLKTGPRQLKTSLADNYDYATDTYRQAITDSRAAKQIGFIVKHDSEEIPFDQKGIRVVSQTLIANASGNQALLVEVENASDDMVYVSVGNVALNGLGVQNGAWSTDWIGAGKRRVISMPLSSMLDESYQKMFGLDEIGSVTYSFEIKDMELDTLVVPPTLTFSVPGSTNTYDPSGDEVYQENGIRIISKGLTPDPFNYSDDIHILFLIENGASDSLSFDIDYDSVSVNGYMTNFICSRSQATSGGSTVLDVELMGYSLEQNRITGLEDITEVELTFEFRNNSYQTVATPVVKISVNPSA